MTWTATWPGTGIGTEVGTEVRAGETRCAGAVVMMKVAAAAVGEVCLVMMSGNVEREIA